MIVEIKEYSKDETLILVTEIVKVKYECETRTDEGSINKKHYKFSIKLRDGSVLSFHYNTREEECKKEYQKVKDALYSFYKKDTIKEEISKYLQILNKDDFKS